MKALEMRVEFTAPDNVEERIRLLIEVIRPLDTHGYVLATLQSLAENYRSWLMTGSNSLASRRYSLPLEALEFAASLAQMHSQEDCRAHIEDFIRAITRESPN